MSVNALEELVKAYLPGDTEDLFVGVMTRNEAHTKGLVTWTSQVIIPKEVGGKTFFLLTLRSKGCHGRYIGYWQVGYTETIDADEVAKEAAARGGWEELGANQEEVSKRLRSLPDVRYRNPKDPSDRKNAAVFELMDYNGGFKPNHSEIAVTRLVLPAEIRQITLSGFYEGKPITPLSVEVWKMYDALVLKQK